MIEKDIISIKSGKGTISFKSNSIRISKEIQLTLEEKKNLLKEVKNKIDSFE